MQTRSFLSILLSVFFLSLSSNISFGEVLPDNENSKGIIFHKGDWESALKRAESEDKLVFLDAYASWCGPCKWMSKNVFTDEKVGGYYNANFINVKIDMEIGEGIELAKKYDISAYPTLLFLSSDGKMLHRVCGARKVDDFIAQGERALDPDMGFASIIGRFDAESAEPIEMESMLEEYEGACVDNTELLNKYFTEFSIDKNLNEGNWNIIKKYADDPTSSGMIILNDNYSTFVKQFGQNEVENKIFSTYEIGFSRAIRKKDESKMDLLDSSIRGLNSNNQQKIQEYSILQKAKFDEDFEYYANLLVDYLNRYRTEDPKKLNKYAWEFYEHVEDMNMLDKAVEWASLSVEYDRGYYNLDTLAALYFKMGEKESANKYATEAIDEAIKHGQDYSSTEELLEQIKGLN